KPGLGLGGFPLLVLDGQLETARTPMLFGWENAARACLSFGTNFRIDLAVTSYALEGNLRRPGIAAVHGDQVFLAAPLYQGMGYVCYNLGDGTLSDPSLLYDAAIITSWKIRLPHINPALEQTIFQF